MAKKRRKRRKTPLTRRSLHFTNAIKKTTRRRKKRSVMTTSQNLKRLKTLAQNLKNPVNVNKVKQIREFKQRYHEFKATINPLYRIKIYASRKLRRESLFAKKKAGKGQKTKRPTFKDMSKVKC